MRLFLYIFTLLALTFSISAEANYHNPTFFQNVLLAENTLPTNNITSKTLIKTIALKNASSINLDLKGKVEIKEWSENTVRVQMNITLNNSTTHMLKYLMSKGRYNLDLDYSDDILKIDATSRSQSVIVSKDGATLDEEVSYTIFVPKNIDIASISKENKALTTASEK